MAKNNEVKVIISAEISKLKNGMKQAKSAVEGFSSETNSKSKEIKENLDKAGESGGKLGGALKTAGKAVGTAFIASSAAAGAALGKITKSALENYASYEQLTGGIDTLFKDSSIQMQKYADEAYKTAGLSANAYMETVTGFSAAMIKSLDGDTAKAAEASNQAIIDMSDNANKMGSSMESIQNAYAGFSKQNYTMLDNLKLGYGGTKEEMQRLLTDAEKLTGKKFDISNFADITEAIHAIQTEMGITGTTAKEATQTIEGSVSSTKAAYQNLLTGLASGSDELPELVKNVVDGALSVVKNVLPEIKNIAEGIPTIITELATEIPPIITDLISTLIPVIIGSIPPILTTVLEVGLQILQALIQGIVDNIDALVDCAIGMVTTLVDFIGENIDLVLDAAIKIVMAVLKGIVENLDKIIEGALQIITTLVEYITGNVDDLIVAAIEIIITLAEALLDNIDDVINAALEIVLTIVNELTKPDTLMKLIDAGLKLIWELIKGIVKALPDIINAAINIIKTYIDTIKSFWSNIFSLGGELIGKIKDGISEKFTAFKEWVGTKISSVKDTIGEKFAAVKDKITAPIEKARDTVKSIIDKIKGFFKFEWNLPKIKLPHISITPTGWKVGDLLQGSIPKLGIKWYAKGGIMNKPTLLGLSGNTAHIGGEAGKEAIVPLERNTEWLDKLADRITEKLQGNRQPIILQVDGKTFGEVAVNSINNITKQTGSIPLKVY